MCFNFVSLFFRFKMDIFKKKYKKYMGDGKNIKDLSEEDQLLYAVRLYFCY
jgi:hypothetical protein